MPYHGLYLGGHGAEFCTPEAYPNLIRPFFESCGWEFVQEVNSSSYVFRTFGRGNRLNRPVYVHVYGTHDFHMDVYLEWDTNTSTGSGGIHGVNNSKMLWRNYDPELEIKFLAGCEDYIYLASTGSSGERNQYNESLVYIADLAFTNGILSAGVSSGATSVEVDDVSGFREGWSVQIHGLSGEGRETVTVDSISGNTVTFTSAIAGNYSPGSLLGRFPFPVIRAGGRYGLSGHAVSCPHVDSGLNNHNFDYDLYFFGMEGPYNSFQDKITKQDEEWRYRPLTYKPQPISYNPDKTIMAKTLEDGRHGLFLHGYTRNLVRVYHSDDVYYRGAHIIHAQGSNIIRTPYREWTPGELVGKWIVGQKGWYPNSEFLLHKIIGNDEKSITLSSVPSTEIAPKITYAIVNKVMICSDKALYSESSMAFEVTASSLTEVIGV